MRITNTYRRHEGMLAIFVAVVLTILVFLLRYRWAGFWSIGGFCLVLLVAWFGVMRTRSRLEANVDSALLVTEVTKVERTFGGLTYNGKQLKHYNKIRLTHAPIPYADERKRTLWLHPEHFAVDESALAVWQENGGIITEEKHGYE